MNQIAPPPPFPAWLEALKAEAAATGVGKATLEQALEGIKPIPRVIELDRRQPEFTLTLGSYFKNAISAKRISMGKEMLKKHRASSNAGSAQESAKTETVIRILDWRFFCMCGKVEFEIQVFEFRTQVYNGAGFNSCRRINSIKIAQTRSWRRFKALTSAFDRHQNCLGIKITDDVRTRILEKAKINIACADPNGIKTYESETSNATHTEKSPMPTPYLRFALHRE